ncbi:MFS transporter [Herbaspirillum sp. WKF16]|uniref:MFS transporter n=1 Tax=Herbaspirillum sp. WKF16 TaxID=3028312 RepID=UPI0023A9427C|nr:MFS transporter [Herbaspirillum sp. WKF16]WDZ95831.1 MFS transporter [Herbaspirillum sp. WKF16]
MEATKELAAPARKWNARLTSKHWKTLKGAFLGWIFDGYEALALVVVLSPLLKSLLTPEQAASKPFYAGMVIGITLLGWGVGGLVGGVLADYVGRKTVMMWSVFLYALFTGLTAFSDTIVTMCLLRFITGLAMGSEWSTGIALVAETWPAEARAKGAGFLQSGFGWGTLAAALIWYLLQLSMPLGDDTWRVMFVVGALPAFFVLYIRKDVGESEEWIAAVKNQEWAATEESSEKGGKRPFTLKQVFTEREAVRRILLTSLLSVVSIAGWWAVSSWLTEYTRTISAAQGIQSHWDSYVSLLYTTGAIIAYIVSGFMADAMGRRWFLFVTFAGSLATTFLIYSYASTVTEILVFSPINGFFTLGCAFSWLAIYPSELFNTSVRSTAVSFVFNSARLVAWFFPIAAGAMIKTFGGIAPTALAFGCVYAIGLVVPWFLPETAGKDQ